MSLVQLIYFLWREVCFTLENQLKYISKDWKSQPTLLQTIYKVLNGDYLSGSAIYGYRGWFQGKNQEMWLLNIPYGNGAFVVVRDRESLSH